MSASPKKIIGICGPAGSGKTTLANMLSDAYGYVRVPFADPLKAMLAKLIELQGGDLVEQTRLLRGNLKDEPSRYFAGQTPRCAMQTLGTEWRNLIDTELWTKIWENRLGLVYSGYELERIVVDDLRFLHEESVLRKHGATIIGVSRQGFTSGPHASESAYLAISPNIQLKNNSTPEAMFAELIHFMAGKL